jgi:hypothetical protein
MHIKYDWHSNGSSLIVWCNTYCINMVVLLSYKISTDIEHNRWGGKTPWNRYLEGSNCVQRPFWLKQHNEFHSKPKSTCLYKIINKKTTHAGRGSDGIGIKNIYAILNMCYLVLPTCNRVIIIKHILQPLGHCIEHLPCTTWRRYSGMLLPHKAIRQNHIISRQNAYE